MRVDTRSGAFNGRRSGARLAPAVLASHRRRDLDKHPPVHFPGSRRSRAIKLASRGGECESAVKAPGAEIFGWLAVGLVTRAAVQRGGALGSRLGGALGIELV